MSVACYDSVESERVVAIEFAGVGSKLARKGSRKRVAEKWVLKISRSSGIRRKEVGRGLAQR